MRRHELDWVSLLAGALFVSLAVIYVAAEAADVRLDPHWVLPAVLVGLGIVGLAASLRGNARSRDGVDQPAEPSAPAAAEPAAAEPAAAQFEDEETTLRLDDAD